MKFLTGLKVFLFKMWIYVQKTGNLYNGNGLFIASGYAGHGEGVNNPALQNIHQEGPLPCGIYTIGAPYHNPKTGVYTMNLVPDPGNVMFGRSDFRIHGDNGKGNRSASEGCPVFPHEVRTKVWESGDHTLKVIAEEINHIA